jgi:hypothetical protein
MVVVGLGGFGEELALDGVVLGFGLVIFLVSYFPPFFSVILEGAKDVV